MITRHELFRGQSLMYNSYIHVLFCIQSLRLCKAGGIVFCSTNISQERLLEILRFIKMELERAAQSTPDKFDATLS